VFDDNVYLGLGSNLGDRTAHLQAGLAGLRAAGLRLLALSSFYLTEPDLRPTAAAAAAATTREGLGDDGETPPSAEAPSAHPPYVNCVAAFESDLEPRALLDLCTAVEARQGRRRPARATARPEPRTLDIDVLLIGQRIVDEPGLTVPHPLMMHRRFVLQPLAEIAPTLHHPVLHSTMSEALAQLPDENGVTLLQPQPDEVS
jgi:2-amino-4-hydroxy-6-hydroxymethyldihydropteridine diphosphokinase